MKPRLFALLLLAGMLLLVGLMPARAQTMTQHSSDPVAPRPNHSSDPSSILNDPQFAPSTAETLAQEITGYLSLIWGDSAPSQPPEHPLLYRLTDERGQEYDLVVDARSAVSPGHLLLLNGQRVRAVGQAPAAPTRPGEAKTLYLSSVTAVSPGIAAPNVVGSSPWVSLMCKFGDVSDEPQNQQFFQQMYGSSRPGLDHYWREVSYNKVNVQGSAAFGWYTLPHPRSYYVDDEDGTDLSALVNDCTAVADADVYFPNYVGINLMFNDWLGCCAWGGSSYLTLDGVEQSWRTTWEPPWAYSDISVIYHEMGHGFGMPHSSGDYGYVYDNVWDVMSADRYNCDDAHIDPVYGCLGQNTIAFHHDLVEWLAPEQIYSADVGSHILTLEQIDQPATDDYLMAKIPVEGSSNHFFTVEVRRRVGYDAKVPGDAVIIHEVDFDWGAHVVDSDWNEDTSDEGAMWRVGETFVDDTGEISITVDAATPTGFEISIENNSEPPTDPYEPNDIWQDATPIAYGAELDGGLIQVPGDVDWYTFEGLTGDEMQVYVDAWEIDSALQPQLTLYHRVGANLEELSSGYNYNNGDPYLEWYLQEDGDYYLQIIAADHGYDGGGGFFYRLSLYRAEPWQFVELGVAADAYVRQASKTTNYGNAAFLRVQNASADTNAYLKFWVDLNVPVGQCLLEAQPTLRTFVKEPSTDSGSVYVAGNGWQENAINWNNAPPISDPALGTFGQVSDEQYAFAYLDWPLGSAPAWLSLAIRNNSTNSVDFSSAEGPVSPALEIWQQNGTVHQPRARIWADSSTGLAPLTINFSADASGCPTSWYWDFGDGTTSTEQNPTHIFTDVGWYYVTLTVANAQGSYTNNYWTQVVSVPTIVYISPAADATIGGILAQGADILRYDKASNGWTMVFDGSDHGLTKNIGSFSFTNAGELLLVYSANQTIPGLGTATPYDVVRFSPDVPGLFPLGSGTYSFAWKGLSNGLTKAGEKIDALDESWDDLFISTSGAGAILTAPVIKIADEDVIFWSSWDSAWSRWVPVDGSRVPGLAAEDIVSVWQDSETYNDYYVTILGAFNLGGVTGNDASIVRLSLNGDTFTASIFPWLAPGTVFNGKIDALELER